MAIFGRNVFCYVVLLCDDGYFYVLVTCLPSINFINVHMQHVSFKLLSSFKVALFSSDLPQAWKGLVFWIILSPTEHPFKIFSSWVRFPWIGTGSRNFRSWASLSRASWRITRRAVPLKIPGWGRPPPNTGPPPRPPDF